MTPEELLTWIGITGGGLTTIYLVGGHLLRMARRYIASQVDEQIDELRDRITRMEGFQDGQDH